MVCAHLICLCSLKTCQNETSPSTCEVAQPREAVTEIEGCQREQVILGGEALSARTCVQQCQVLICLTGEAAGMDVQV